MRAWIGLGSNQGDRAANLAAARAELARRGVPVVAASGVYETEPVGGPRQPDYLNQVVEVETALGPRDLLGLCQEIEAAIGRDRSREARWGPRPIDLDILAVGEATVAEPGLVVPHPRLAERAFALVPLAEIAPDLEIPGFGRVSSLAASAPGGVRPWPAPNGATRGAGRRRWRRARP